MITKQLISSLFFLTILIVKVQQGVSLKCYTCSSDNEKDDCWVKPDSLTTTECGASNPTESPSTSSPEVTTPGPTTPTPGPTTPTPGPTTPTPGPTTPTPAPTTPTPAPTTPTPAPTTPTPAPTTPTPAPTTPTPAPTTPTPAPTTPTPAPTTPTPAPTTPAPVSNRALSPEARKIVELFTDFLQKQSADPVVKRSKRDTTDWECAKIITKNGEKKQLERKCVKKSEETCKNKTNDSDNKCAVCSDKDLCNSASNIKLQLIPAFLSVFLALFLSSQ